MPTVETLSIALPVEMADAVRQAVDAGDYSSQSEVVRDALQDWTRKRGLPVQGIATLRKLWEEAVADNSEGEDPEPIFDALERKYAALAEAAER